MANEVRKSLSELRKLIKGYRTSGQELYDACGGELFPCDGLAMAVLDRSLNIAEGFLLLMPKHGYICVAALLRMQLDNVLRLHGVIRTADPHGIAQSVIDGTSMRTLKDKTGAKMTDARLLELLEPGNPWVRSIYEQASEYVHLSSAHVLHFLSRSSPGKDGRRIFRIGNNDDHLSMQERRALIVSFTTVTRGVLSLVDLWSVHRMDGRSLQELRQRFPRPV
jgi:hypothetical protein